VAIPSPWPDYSRRKRFFARVEAKKSVVTGASPRAPDSSSARGGAAGDPPAGVVASTSLGDGGCGGWSSCAARMSLAIAADAARSTGVRPTVTGVSGVDISIGGGGGGGGSSASQGTAAGRGQVAFPTLSVGGTAKASFVRRFDDRRSSRRRSLRGRATCVDSAACAWAATAVSSRAITASLACGGSVSGIARVSPASSAGASDEDRGILLRCAVFGSGCADLTEPMTFLFGAFVPTGPADASEVAVVLIGIDGPDTSNIDLRRRSKRDVKGFMLFCHHKAAGVGIGRWP